MGKFKIHGRKSMTWSAPTIREICLGMEINMYHPADEGEGELF